MYVLSFLWADMSTIIYRLWLLYICLTKAWTTWAFNAERKMAWKKSKQICYKKLRRLSFKNWHQKKESRRREWDIERGQSLYRYILSPLFVSSLNLFLIPADFRWQTMTDNIRQPQLTRDREDQCKWSKRIFLQSPSCQLLSLMKELRTLSPALPCLTWKLKWSWKIHPYFQNVMWVVA